MDGVLGIVVEILIRSTSLNDRSKASTTSGSELLQNRGNKSFVRSVQTPRDAHKGSFFNSEFGR